MLASLVRRARTDVLASSRSAHLASLHLLPSLPSHALALRPPSLRASTLCRRPPSHPAHTIALLQSNLPSPTRPPLLIGSTKSLHDDARPLHGTADERAPNSSPLAPAPSLQLKLPEEVRRRTESIYETILAPLNKQLLGPLERRPFNKGVPLPFVLVLGNHSSGKSSFINYLLGRQIQTTGVAPTDDGFTVISPGDQDTDRDGPSFIGDPSLGFGALRSFGPAFLSHIQLKVRKELACSKLMLVDSPGMIDSPGSQRPSPYSGTNSTGLWANPRTAERGYDFLGVTKWLAEQADVILLFFDPDKPGTTGETLECLTSSLSSSEHKLLLIMNKVDQFVHIHDFARAYGSLCWNLSKVIPRKDLPRIYTMFLPPSALKDRAPLVLTPERDEEGSPLSHAMRELDSTREEVLRAVHLAPERRVDNLITRAHDELCLLRMHALVGQAARSEYANRRALLGGVAGVVLLAPQVGATYIWMEVGASAQQCAGLGGLGVLGAALVGLYARHSLALLSSRLLGDRAMDELFAREFRAEVAENDEFVHSLWRRVRPPLQRSLETLSLGGGPRLPV